MIFRFYILIGMSHTLLFMMIPSGILLLSVETRDSEEIVEEDETDYSQVQGMDVDTISLSDDLSKYAECKDLFLPESDVMNFCKNFSVCRLLPGPERYLQVFCDCSNTVTETYYYMGPQCETKMVISYSQNVSGLLNTSWLEDLLAKNSWKNDFSRVGPLM